MKNMMSKIDGYFHITKRGSTFAREIIGGVIVFFAMIYILPVSASIFGQAGMPAGAVFVATALVSGVATIIMGVYAGCPVALSVGMSMNAFIAFTICDKLQYSWEEALALVIITGALFLLLSVTGLRQKIINAFPRDLKYAITAGLGFFIAFVGLKMGGVITADKDTFVRLGRLNNPVVLLALFGIILSFALSVASGNIAKFSVVIAALVTAALGLLLGGLGVENMPAFSSGAGEPISAVFGKGFGSIPDVAVRFESYLVIFSLIFVNIFDSSATIIAVREYAGYEDELYFGKNRAFHADAFGSLLGGVAGSAALTAYAESMAGVRSGARTGLMAVVTGILFLLSILLYPLFSVFSAISVNGQYFTPVTSSALVAVGAMLFSNLRHIDWNDRIITFTAFAFVMFIVFTYSLADGIGLGIIIYILMKLSSGKGKDVSIILYIVGGFFLINFVFTEVLNIL